MMKYLCWSVFTKNSSKTSLDLRGLADDNQGLCIMIPKSDVKSRDYRLSINPLECFFGSEGHVALDRNPGPGYNTLLLRLIPGDLLSACPDRQFHTLPGLLDSRAALWNSYPNACVPMQGGSSYHFYDGLWYDPTGTRTHDLLCERRTR